MLKKTLYAVAAMLGLAAVVVAVLAVAAPGVLPDLGESSAGLAGAVSNAAGDESRGSASSVTDRRPEKAASGSAEESATPEGPYRPSSQFIADGFDPDRTVMDFEEAAAKREAGPKVGVLSTADVQRIVYDRANRLIPCYQKVLDTRPEAAGNVDFEFAIAPSGDVLMVRVASSELESKLAEDCMVGRMKGWSFPATKLQVPTRLETGMMFQLQR